MKRFLAIFLSAMLSINGLSVTSLAEETEQPPLAESPSEPVSGEEKDSRDSEEELPEETQKEENPDETSSEEILPEETKSDETEPEETVPEKTPAETDGAEDPDRSENETLPEEKNAPEETDAGSEALSEAEEETVKVIFLANAEGEMEPQIFIVGEEGKLTANAFVREGYVFVSWNTAADGEGTDYEDGQEICFEESSEELLLHAVWEEDRASLPTETDGAFEYRELEDGTVEILKYTGSEAEVMIPAEIHEKPVSAIGSGAFENNSTVCSVNIHAGITSIGRRAFGNCTALTQIVLPQGVKKIEAAAFGGCTSLQSAALPEGLTEISRNLFRGCTSLQQVYVPRGVTRVGAGAFEGCEQLFSVTLPEGVTEIGGNAFSGCASLYEVHLPDTLTTLGIGAFRSCGALTEISLPEGVSEIGTSVFGGCTSLTVLNAPGVQSIAIYALDDCSALRTMYTPNLKSMSGTAFGLFVINRVESLDLRNAESIDFDFMKTFIHLKEITLGPSLKTISTGAFALVPRGLTVNFRGSAEEWEKVDIKPLNPSVVNAEIVYLIPVTGIVIEKEEMNLTNGEICTIGAHVLPEDASDQRIYWSSSDVSVAEVDADGMITAVAVGQAVITAKSADNGFTASCTVTVIPDRIYITGLCDSYAYTGKAIRPVVQVYDGEKLLSENNDYTISYKNNIKAALKTGAKAPTITVKGKGKYTSKKDVTFTIAPASMKETTVQEMTLVQSKTPKKLKLSPKITWNGTSLKSTDYEIDPKDWDLITTGDHEILLKGKGSFTDEIPFIVHVLPYGAEITPVTKLKVSSKTVAYSEDLTLRKVIEASGFIVRDGKKDLIEGTDYELSDDRGCTGAGACTFVLAGKTLYSGTRTVSITIKGTSLSLAKTTGTAVYDGTAKKLEDGITVMSGKTVLVKDRDYEVLEATYENNINAGKANVTIRGLGGYTGSKKLTFVISPSTGEKTVFVNEAYYTKSGVIPEVNITAGGRPLREGADYRLSCSGNKKAGSGTVTVKYLGNYKGTPDYTASYVIHPMPIFAITVFAQDPVWSKKKGNFIPKLTLMDENGKTLSAGKDYDKNVAYYDKDGNPIDPKAILEKGSYVKAIIKGMGNYTGEAEVEFHVIEKTQSLSNATIRIRDLEYNGGVIIPGSEDIVKAAMKVNKTTVNLVYGTDYELYSTVNNVEKGIAKAVFIGKGQYAGYKTVSFKITKRSMEKNWLEALFAAFGF